MRFSPYDMHEKAFRTVTRARGKKDRNSLSREKFLLTVHDGVPCQTGFADTGQSHDREVAIGRSEHPLVDHADLFLTADEPLARHDLAVIGERVV